ncbi:MAG TPA: homoserine kinase [Chloroflexia bacterium]|nr:homoserine kinase [Chloroflexia bacterium]
MCPHLQEESKALQVSVPATSANLGPGFDVLGLALDLRNVFQVTPAARTTITIEGHGAHLPTGEDNLFYKAFQQLHNLAGQQAPPLQIHMQLNVPPGKGLGSSATAVVGGLVAANAYLGMPFGPMELLAEAITLEHGSHADNVAPALLGGLVANVIDDGKVISIRLPIPNELQAALFIPDFEMDTIQGRALMPRQYPTADVIFNTGRVALFLSALTLERYDLLRIAMQDRIHQPYRSQMFPLLPALIEAAIEEGAHGACLSGGGSSVLALGTERLGDIAVAMLGTARAAGITGQAKVLQIDRHGVQAQWLDGEENA